MRKNMYAGFLAAALAASSVLAGCGDSASEATKADQDAQETSAQGEASGGENGGSGSNELVLYTWDLMFPDEILDGFEEETGIEVVYSKFDTDEAMFQKLSTAEGGDYDLIFADDYIIESAIDAGLVQKLDPSKLENYGNIDSRYQGQFYDPEDEYTVPFGAGIPLIVYDPELVDFEIKGYEDLWNESLTDSVALIANGRVITGITLLSMGESMNTEDTAVIEAAGEKLLQLAPNVRLIQDDNTQNALLNGEASVAFLYTSQVYAALQENPDLKVVVPEEGLGFGVIAGFIPSQAPNSEAAYQFLDYILDAEHSAACTQYVGYYSTNTAGAELIPEDVAQLLVAPEGKTMEMVENVSQEANDVYNKVWTEFKAACD